MSLSFYSQHWYRVADLRIRLRQHAALHRHVYRGEPWYVLYDRVTGQVHRFDVDTQRIIGLMDGRRTLQEIWDIACVQLGDDMPTQDEIIELVAKLHRANAVVGDLPPSVEELVNRGREFRRRKFLQQLRSPLGIRIPLVDPERFLNATIDLVRPLLGRVAGAFWFVMVVSAAILALMHREALGNSVTDQLFSAQNLFAIWLIYPVVKLVHELGHGYLVKRYGGEVHEMGVMLLVFVPVPYVDASAATVLDNKYQRALIGAAGIMVEVFLASLALFFWILAEPGTARSVAFNVMLISGVSTVLFNGNPLLRFDAYYVLCDLIESPNLGTRGNRYVAYLVKRYLYGVREARAPYAARGEAPWLAGYSVTSYIYRLFIMVTIVLFVATQYFVIGVILALWSAASVFVFPIFQTLKKAVSDPQLKTRPVRFASITATLAALLLVVVTLVPMPLATFAEGVVWAERDARLFAPANGFVDEVVVQSGDWVEQGRVLMRCSDPRIEADRQVLEASLREARARRQANIRDRTQREVIDNEIVYIERELARLEERRSNLVFRSPRHGRFIVPDFDDLAGSWITRGQLIGFVVAENELSVNVPLPQDDFELLADGVRAIEARFASRPEATFSAALGTTVPAASRELPSLVLTTDGGGRIARDPEQTEHVAALENHFHVRLDVPAADMSWLDERVYVLFRHPPEALVHRWYRAVRRLFLRQFDI